MKREELIQKISEVEREIALLPAGSITKKNIKNNDYYYLRINKDGKRSETYIRFEELDELSEQIRCRKNLEKILKAYRKQLTELMLADEQSHEVTTTSGRSLLVQSAQSAQSNEEPILRFRTMVRRGSQLKAQCVVARKYKKRACYSELSEYLYGEVSDKVFVIYGLRRTGKTTMVRQALVEMNDEDFARAAYIQITTKDTLESLDEDIRLLESNGYKYIFIDEVTLLEDFVEGSAVFADIYASSGMKIVLSGTDSLGFALSQSEQLYDRCVMVHTTFIPYREFEEVLGISGIDEYIRFGGTMSLGGINYNEKATFASSQSTEAYIDTAIAKNIQHSLKMYEHAGHFRSLLDLYERGELTNVINRVIENINHRFTRSVVERTFRSHDISVTAVNMLNDKTSPMNIKNHMDLDAVTKGMMNMLEIIDKEAQTIEVADSHMTQIKEYLSMLDLIVDIDLEYLPVTDRRDKFTVISQPGLRYAQAETIVENLLKDSKFNELDASERKLILNRLLDEVRGRMMEEIVLLETKLAYPHKQVFKLQFAAGEFDMVVFDPEEPSCEIYEIKHGTEQVDAQYRHLTDENKCSATAHRYGDIKGKYVIYRGECATVDGIQYLNVETYLKQLQC